MKFIVVKTEYGNRISLNIETIERVVEMKENETEIYPIGAEEDKYFVVNESFDDVMRKIENANKN